jgi:hypothetical protein
MLTKPILYYKNCLKIKASKKLKLILQNTITDRTLTYASETWTLNKER